jgi:hypothetical protein
MFSILTLGLAALATAAPTKRQVVPHYPTTSRSTGFTLVANVTSLSADFVPSVNNWVVSTAHVGAGQNIAVLTPETDEYQGRIFYQNGTAEEVHYHQTTIITDGSTPLVPYGVQVPATAGPDVTISVGAGTNLYLTGFPEPYSYIGGPGTFVACNETLAYYNANFITLQYAYPTFTNAEGNYEFNPNIPAGCAPVHLVPQCATLNDLPAGSFSSHEFAANIACYDDVSAIVWSEYGP